VPGENILNFPFVKVEECTYGNLLPVPQEVSDWLGRLPEKLLLWPFISAKKSCP
jgi:hypothetical protein